MHVAPPGFTISERTERTLEVTRGARILLRALRYSVLGEFPLPDGGRADLFALAKDGSLRIIEIKSSFADFRADAKWMRYRAYCDRFYFAVPLHSEEARLRDAVPQDAGLIIADAHGANVNS